MAEPAWHMSRSTCADAWPKSSDAWLVPPHNPPRQKRAADRMSRAMRLSALFEEFAQYLKVERGGESSEHRHIPALLRLLPELCEGSDRRVSSNRAPYLGAVPKLSVLYGLQGASAGKHPGPPGSPRQLRKVDCEAQPAREEPNGSHHTTGQAEQDPQRPEVGGRRAVHRPMLSASRQSHVGLDGLRWAPPR